MKERSNLRINKPAAVFNFLVAAIYLGTAFQAWATPRFHLENDSQGRVKPFHVMAFPLAEFVREYGRLTGRLITLGEDEVQGTVTLFLRKPLSQGTLTEVLYRVLADNGYAVVDAPAGNGWIIQRMRDARDASLPVWEAGKVPDSARYVTAYRDLRYRDAEEIARTLRSFMPANSRIIPVTASQVFVTDTASNIRKLEQIMAHWDSSQAAKGDPEEQSLKYRTSMNRSCGEQRVQKLVVEKLEIHEVDKSSGSPNGGAGK